MGRVSSNLTAPTILLLRQLRRQREVQAAEVHFKLPVGPGAIFLSAGGEIAAACANFSTIRFMQPLLNQT
jgi:hypothetical protein